MADIASAVISCFTFLWENIRICYSYAQIYRSHRNSLKEKATTLAAIRTDVDRKVAEAETRGDIIKEGVKNWIVRAATLTHDLDDFEKNGGQATSFFSYCCWRCERIEKVDTLTSRIAAILAEQQFESVSDPPTLPAPTFLRSTTIDNFEKVTTEAAVNKVREALRNDEVSVIGVFGTGGVGKTTLVKKVAEQVMEEGLYNRVVFATISKPPNLVTIQIQIAASFGLSLVDNQQRRANQINDIIKRQKKVLIVLDDLWGELKLNEVGLPSGNELANCESKIVLTTRIEHVCHRMKCHKIRLDTWPKLESRDFFKRTAGTEFDCEEFESIADSVADECNGLPLALVAVAKALGDKDKEEWSKALLRLQRSIPPNGDDDGIVYERIKLSYDYLQAKEQRCFLTCCLFPEDHNIKMEKVARYVFGLGLFPEADTLEEARGNTETILKKLIASGLLLTSNENERVKMHDVVRDVAIQITSIESQASSSRENGIEEGKQVFIVQTGNDSINRDLPWRETYESYTAISSMFNTIRTTLRNGPSCPKLQTLLLQHNYYLEEIQGTFFEKMNALRVLDLSRSKASSIPSSIMFLTMLRTLHLDGCKFTDVSALGALQQLMILSLKESVILELPQDIGKLINLRMLDLTSCSKLTIQPNVLNGLSRLEELYMKKSFAKWKNDTDTETSGNASFEEVVNLHRLTALEVNISNPKCLPQDLKAVPEWRRFNLSVSVSKDPGCYAEQNRANSRKLFLGTSMKNFPDWFNTAVSKKTENLIYIKCTELNLLEEHDRGCLRGLKFLFIQNCLELKEHLMHNGEDGELNCQPVFKGLQQLKIFNTNITNICVLKLPTGSLENLEQLQVVKCGCLVNSLLPSNLVKRLRNLKSLYAYLISVEEVFGFENLEEGLYLGRLEEIVLLKLEKLKNMWKGPTRLADFTNLRLVEVSACSTLTNLFSDSITEGLLNLEYLCVAKCDKMKCIIQNEEAITPQSVKLPKLKELSLINLPMLNSFYNGNAVLQCPSLEYLTVQDCPMFQTLASAFNSSNQVNENDPHQIDRIRGRLKQLRFILSSSTYNGEWRSVGSMGYNQSYGHSSK